MHLGKCLPQPCAAAAALQASMPKQGKLNPYTPHMKSLLLPIVALGLCLDASAKPTKGSGLPEGVKYNANIFYTGMKTKKKKVAGYRIPAIVTAKDGTLVAAIDERVPSLGDLVHSDDINIAVKLSRNNGKSWLKEKIIVDFPHGQSASDPSMIVNEKTGHIFLFYNFMDRKKEHNVYYLHYVVSKNNGKSWSKPVDITDQIAKPEWKNDFKFMTSGRGCYTTDGKMLHTLVNLKRGLFIFGSDDDGKTWYFIDTPIKPADESKIIELSDGRWMVNARVNGNTKKRYVHISSDKGKTWTSRPEPQLPDAACNGSIIRYSSKAAGDDKDRLIFSNANSTKRENLTVRISYDEGETWSAGKVIYPGSSAYSDLTKLDNGDIAVFFEKDGHKNNEVVVFDLDWLTDGKDKNVPTKKKKK